MMTEGVQRLLEVVTIDIKERIEQARIIIIN